MFMPQDTCSSFFVNLYSVLTLVKSHGIITFQASAKAPYKRNHAVAPKVPRRNKRPPQVRESMRIYGMIRILGLVLYIMNPAAGGGCIYFVHTTHRARLIIHCLNVLVDTCIVHCLTTTLTSVGLRKIHWIC